MVMFSVGIMVISLISVATSLIAFDCNNDKTNITAISLKDVGRCPELDTGYEQRDSYIQVIEKGLYQQIHVQTCLIEVSRVIMHCGFMSHSSLVEDALGSYVHQIGGEACQKVHAFKEYIGFHGKIFSNLKSNQTIKQSVTLAGKLDAQGACEGTEFYEGGQKWSQVVVTAEVTITLSDYYTTASLDANEIRLTGGVTCHYDDSYCMDVSIGESVWNKFPPKECENYQVIYDGEAKIITEKIARKEDEKLFGLVEYKARIFALRLIRKTQLCGEIIWETEHPRLVILEKTHKDGSSPWTNFNGYKSYDIVRYINSKFLYVEVSWRRLVNTLMTSTIHRRCLLRREVLKNRLAMGTVSPNIMATLVKDTAGYIAQVVGEVIYLLRCQPVTVDIRRTERCYEELPVTRQNKSYFMSPITHILTEYGKETECNVLIPPMFQIGDKWVKMVPHPAIAQEPIQLEPDTEGSDMTYQSIQDLGSGGLYTYEEISNAQKSLVFQIERPAINNIIIRKISGKKVDSQGLTTLALFDAHELEEIANNTIKRLYGAFEWLGRLTSGLLGLYVLYRLIRFFVEALLNAVAIHKTTGCTFHLLGSFWNTLTLFILHQKTHKRHGSPCEIYVKEAEPTAPQCLQETSKGEEIQEPSGGSYYFQEQEDVNYATLRRKLLEVPPPMPSMGNITSNIRNKITDRSQPIHLQGNPMFTLYEKTEGPGN